MIRLLATICLCAGLEVGSAPVSELLVLEKAQNTLVIVDPVALKILARVPAGNDPHEVAVSDDGRTAYISNYGAGSGLGGNTITVVDLVARQQLPAIDLGALRAPHGMAFAGGKVYFTIENSKAVGSYDPATRKVDWVVGTGQDRTHMVVVSADAKTIFTTNVSSATASIIQQSTGQMPGPPPPAGAAQPQPGGPPGAPGPRGPGRADWRVTNVQVGRGAEGMDLSPDGKELWVANAQDQTISVIDVAGKKVVQTLPSTKAANRLKFTVDGRYVFVSDLQGNEMLVIDAKARKEFKRIPLAGNSEGILMSPDGTHAFTTMNSHDAVAVIDLKTMSVVGEVKTGRGPDGLAWATRN
jgi:YVTN family beta-propeller protein